MEFKPPGPENIHCAVDLGLEGRKITTSSLGHLNQKGKLT